MLLDFSSRGKEGCLYVTVSCREENSSLLRESEMLERVLRTTSVVLLEDLNGHIGNNGHTWRGGIGKNGHMGLNPCGESLLDFFESHGDHPLQTYSNTRMFISVHGTRIVVSSVLRLCVLEEERSRAINQSMLNELDLVHGEEAR